MKDVKSRIVHYFRDPPFPRRAMSIGSRRLAVTSVTKKKERLVITGAAMEAIPLGLVEPRFSDLNIKDKDRLSHLIQAAMERAGLLRQRRWSLAIPRQATRTFIIRLDEAPNKKKELAETLQWKVERLLEVSMSDLTASFQRLRSSNGQERYLVSVVSNDVVEAYEALLEPLKMQPGCVMPDHLAQTAWLPRNGTDRDALLVSVESNELSFLFLREGDFLSIRSLDLVLDSLADEIHRSLVYYLDKLAPVGEAGSEPQLDTVLLIGEQLIVSDVEASCQALFPEQSLPTIHTLRDQALEGLDGLTLEDISSAAGLAAMGL